MIFCYFSLAATLPLMQQLLHTRLQQITSLQKLPRERAIFIFQETSKTCFLPFQICRPINHWKRPKMSSKYWNLGSFQNIFWNWIPFSFLQTRTGPIELLDKKWTLPTLLKLAPSFHHEFNTTSRMPFNLCFHPNERFHLKP